ncbi:DGAT1 [Lepeophtheirus salmonis]|uniref:O-acyltransferase n=1 Tax=Lepeophtheirus salmonis TaxID=72036 RepID=A0A7R8H5X1_LEPSM|nr:DGAT1 [Lepeophtheirus salmonis]CAF2886183.1 DGAT1 [Lepeophtheirus salmonis]
MQDIVKEADKKRKFQPNKPVHIPRDSILSLSSDFDNFEGIFNWGVLLLLTGGLRLTLENLNKYGIRVSPKKWLLALLGDSSPEFHLDKYPFMYLMLYLHITVGFVLLVEKTDGEQIHEKKNWIYSSFVQYDRYACCSCIGHQIKILLHWPSSRDYGHYVNYWCYLDQITTNKNGRSSPIKKKASVRNFGDINSNKKEENEGTVHYPDNLSVRDLTYFWYAPTLCYELNFPRMDRIRKVFLLRRFLEVVILVNFTLALIQQWIIPSVINSMLPFNEMRFGRAIERVLKLAIPNHLIWDWWNAENIQKFWTRWNIPVHLWCVRHLYKPIINNYGSRAVVPAKMAVFFLSAFFHEYLISVPLGIVRPYAFLGMMSQLPLFLISSSIEKHFGPRCGNMVVWMSLILGQPLALLMYYHDFVVQHYGNELLENFGDL